MNLSFYIARRYLFAKKSTNAINIIAGISVFGIAVGTAALILVLSVFNGFEDLLSQLYGNFNPDVKVTPRTGKTFQMDTLTLKQLQSLPSVAAVSQTLEEVAFFEYDESQDFGIIKGVDAQFRFVNSLDSSIREGVLAFQEDDRFFAVMGGGMRNKLSVNVDNAFLNLNVFMPKRGNVGNFEQPFRRMPLQPVGTFVIQQDFDNQYVLTGIGFVEALMDAPNERSALEIKLRPNSNTSDATRQIQKVLGKDFIVRDRYRQDEAFLKLMNIEKWLSFAILSLTLVLVAFNMIGSLWMIVLEKKRDIAILKSMGATDIMVRNIFLYEGLLFCGIGLVLGTIIAIALYIAQKTYGIVPIPEGFLVNSYPISMRPSDLIIVGITVCIIGIIAAILPAQRATRVSALIREE